MPDGLYGTTDFQLDILEAQEPWIVVPVLGVIGVNNAGRQARKVKATCFLETRFLLDRCAAQLKLFEIDAPYFNFDCNVYPISPARLLLFCFKQMRISAHKKLQT